MKSGILPWVSHSNMPILSVDVQPNGYRFVTGGSDHKVCIWNLLPAVSARYERGPRAYPPGVPAKSVDPAASNSKEEEKHRKEVRRSHCCVKLCM